MNLLVYLGLIILSKQIINNYFINIIDHHSLFRSFFCFFISTLSLCFSIYSWEHLFINPLEPTYLSIHINKLMLSYMLVDTTYFVITQQIRPELIFHHIVCICLYGLFYDKSIFAFCALGEILSSFNWVGILYPQHEWSVKIFRLYSILFIRFFLWIFTLFLLYQHTFLFWIGLIVVLFFIGLDCYWVWIIISNYIKYKSFIREKIISKANKIIHKKNK
jgi:hypothetical protein